MKKEEYEILREKFQKELDDLSLKDIKNDKVLSQAYNSLKHLIDMVDFEQKTYEKQEAAKPLEEQFKIELNRVQPLIRAHVEDAISSLSKAIELSEETGVAFESEISFANSGREKEVRNYCPNSFRTKWVDVNLKSFGLSSRVGWEYWNQSSSNC